MLVKIQKAVHLYNMVSWFSQDRVKFPQQWGEALAGLFNTMLTSPLGAQAWERRRFGERVCCAISLSHCCISTYLALFIVITVTLIVIVAVCCVAVALLY